VVTYFSLDEVIKLSKNPIYHIYGDRAPGPYSGEDISKGRSVVEGFFVSSTPERIQSFSRFAESHSEFQSFFREKEIKIKLAAELLS
jgi:hypothetical protein